MSRHSTTSKPRRGRRWIAAGGAAFLLAGVWGQSLAQSPQDPTPSRSDGIQWSAAEVAKQRSDAVAKQRSDTAKAGPRRKAATEIVPPATVAPTPETSAAAVPPAPSASEQPVPARVAPVAPVAPAAEEKNPPPLPEAPQAASGAAAASFGLVPPGGSLPSGEECAAAVRRNPWEPRPENAGANATRPEGPAPYGMTSWTTPEADSARFRGRVDGDFTGTTDEIIQWASCKWGFPTDLSRAQAVVETTWEQAFAGDDGESRGLFQMRMTVWGGYPNSANSTAFNADWALGLRRACYEGAMWYPQLRGDLAACIGVHYSGDPDESTWRAYADSVYDNERTKPWLAWSFAGGSPPAE